MVNCKAAPKNILKIKNKALVGISIICFLILIGVSLSIHLVNKIHEETKEIHNKWMHSILKISEMLDQLDNIGKLESKHIQSNNSSEKMELEEQLQSLQKDFFTNKIYYEKLSIDLEEKSIYGIFSRDVEEYFKTQTELIGKSKSTNKHGILTLLENSKSLLDKVKTDLHELLYLNQR